MFTARPARTGVCRWGALLLLPALLLLSAAPGCNRGQTRQTAALAQSGVATSEHLAEFYDLLAKDRADDFALYRLRALRSGPINSDTRGYQMLATQVQRQEVALHARARMARALKATYVALGHLSGYNASGEVRTAAEGLKTQIEAADSHPLTLPIVGAGPTTTGLFDKAAGALGDWLKQGDMRHGVAAVQTVAANVRAVFDAEQHQYVNIVKDYDANVLEHITYLHSKNLLIATSGLQAHLDPYGVQIVPQPSHDPAQIAWDQDNIERINADLDREAEEDADGLAQDLLGLERAGASILGLKDPGFNPAPRA